MIASTEKRLLHPQHDDVHLHLQPDSDGFLTGLTKTGKFHLQRLRLNRPPLVALRRARIANTSLREELSQTQATQKQLAEYLQKLDGEIDRIYQEITRLLKK